MTTFGQRLRSLRASRNWSQERMGFELGVGKAAISKWENGLARPSFEQLLVIKRLFVDQEVTLDYLVDADTGIAGVPADALSGQIQMLQRGLRGAGAEELLSEDECQLLVRYRRLSQRQRRSLLTLLGG